MAERKLFEVEVEETRSFRCFVIAETRQQAEREAEDEAGLGQEWDTEDTTAFAQEIEPGKRSLSKHEQDEIPYGDNPDDQTVSQFLAGEGGEQAEARARFAEAERLNLPLFEGLKRKMIPPEETEQT